MKMLLVALLALGSSPAYADSNSYGTGTSSLTIPPGVTSISISGYGGFGSDGNTCNGCYPGSPGAQDSENYSVKPGDVLEISVGGGSSGYCGPYGVAGADGGSASVTGPTVQFNVNGGAGGREYQISCMDGYASQYCSGSSGYAGITISW